MDVGQLDIICKNVTHNAYYWFKHAINEPLFEVNHSYISQNIEHMKVDIGTSIMKKFYKQISSEQQLNVVTETVNKYKSIATDYAWMYGLKHINS